MKYECKTCNYATDNKSNFNKHLKSVAHTRSIVGVNINVDRKSTKNNKKLSCNLCNKEYACKQSLSKHKLQYCSKNIIVPEIKDRIAIY